MKEELESLCEWKDLDLDLDCSHLGFYYCRECDGKDKDCKGYHIYDPSKRRIPSERK